MSFLEAALGAAFGAGAEDFFSAGAAFLVSTLTGAGVGRVPSKA